MEIQTLAGTFDTSELRIEITEHPAVPQGLPITTKYFKGSVLVRQDFEFRLVEGFMSKSDGGL